MNLRIIVAVMAVPVLTAIFALAIMWFARASANQDPRVRHQLRFVEVAMFLTLAGLSVVTAESAKDRKWALIAIGIVLAVWSFRGVRFLLARSKA